MSFELDPSLTLGLRLRLHIKATGNEEETLPVLRSHILQICGGCPPDLETAPSEQSFQYRPMFVVPNLCNVLDQENRWRKHTQFLQGLNKGNTSRMFQPKLRLSSRPRNTWRAARQGIQVKSNNALQPRIFRNVATEKGHGSRRDHFMNLRVCFLLYNLHISKGFAIRGGCIRIVIQSPQGFDHFVSYTLEMQS